ncbi:MAG TPA: SDR family oxidoreductase [Micromonosporaceae bacterium]|nr:SDR family oxidoreductase [Micromonosporaceae bacterium]
MSGDPMRVLVVGGTGVLGAAVVAELARHGHEVRVLSRRPPAGAAAPAGASSPPGAEWVAGDVRRPGFGLPPADAARLSEQTTHVVSCFGSVAVAEGPRTAVDLHLRGTQRLIEFARGCPHLRAVVHVSSVLVFGRCQGTVGNADLQVGQAFRNWYEYGKFLAETAWQEADGVPVRVLRLGPVLGADGPVAPSTRSGILTALPAALSGLPLPVARRGDFPCYVTDSTAAAQVVRAALEHEPVGGTWTWYDPAAPTLNATLTALCSAWGVIPRIVAAPGLVSAVRLAAPVLGLPREVCDYLSPWPRLAAGILDELPVPLPVSPPRYVERTGELLRAHSLGLVAA